MPSTLRSMLPETSQTNSTNRATSIRLGIHTPWSDRGAPRRITHENFRGNETRDAAWNGVRATTIAPAQADVSSRAPSFRIHLGATSPADLPRALRRVASNMRLERTVARPTWYPWDPVVGAGRSTAGRYMASTMRIPTQLKINVERFADRVPAAKRLPSPSAIVGWVRIASRKTA